MKRSAVSASDTRQRPATRRRNSAESRTERAVVFTDKSYTSSSSLLACGFRQLPPHRFPFVLLIEPRLERREVFGHRTGVHLALASQRLERVGPGLGCAHFQHGLELRAGLLAAVNRAAMERPAAAGRLGQCSMKLELKNLRKEVARVRGVRRNVVLRPRVEKLFA